MKITFTRIHFGLFMIFSLLALSDAAFSQSDKKDTPKLKYPVNDTYTAPVFGSSSLFLDNPKNVKTTVDYDPVINKYIIKQTVNGKLAKPPIFLTFKEYQDLDKQNIVNSYWKTIVATGAKKPDESLIPSLTINSKSFEKIFGGNTINIQPRGSADLTFSGRINRNENPLFNLRQRKQGNFDFNQRIQMNVIGNIGDKLKITTNYNTEAQFDFENQVKLEYTGKKDEIIKKIEAGMVSFPLNTTLISGSQALFGLKTQLQFGRLGVTSIYSQQKSQSKQINISNGAQQNDFRITSDGYEANKHYFLAQYFRNNYNRAMANLPIITSNINITKIEVWVTNKTGSTTDSRDILAFMDLGENNPYNKTLFQGGPGFSALPAGFNGPGFAQESNNLLQNIPPGARQTNSNDIDTYFRNSGSTDNYNKLTYARKLTDKEYTLHPQLGYISLNTALNADEVLAVAYRYTVNGVEYQVGEFSTDLPVTPDNPQVLYTKLLKNETTKTNLPIWDLMMKNIYALGAYQISPTDFNLNIFRLDDQSGVEKPLITEGQKTNGKLWLQVLNLDRLDQQGAKQPDGKFDFLDGITIDAQNGKIIFPTIEPFGKDLAAQFDPVSEQSLINKYVYQPLYDSTKTIAQQLYPNLNRYVIKGTYQSQVSSEFQLNAINVPEGSVVVTAGTLKLQEGVDYTVDYNIGRVKILNEALLNSGQPITIKLESNELFGIQQKSLFGTRLDYKVNDNFNIGATLMNLKETPLTQKVNYGEESISNTIYGFDLNYNKNSRFLTKLVDKIPLISTKETSSISFNGEFASFKPGHPKALNFAGSSGGTSYIDDFEGARSVIDIKSANTWQISGTPQLFPESQLSNDLSYGFNRAKLAFFNIDPIFYSRTSNFTPPNIQNNKTELSNQYVRQVLETEVFPYKQVATGTLLTLPTFNLAYYPMLRGPYNFATTGINPDGTLTNPKNRWGGIFRKIETNDFEALNIEYIEFWVMDPFIYKPNSQGGDLYFNLGNISEDILKDGRKSLENGLPANGDTTQTDETVWGRVPKLQPVIQAFDNDPNARKVQDVGLDGLDDAGEQQKYQTIVNQVTGILGPQAAATFKKDPASDDYMYYRGPELDQENAGILKRYENYNGTEGNSKTSQQSQADIGIANSASTSLPDGEDINRDNNESKADEYFQYKVSIRPQDMVVGQNFITDKVISNVTLANGTKTAVTWYQFKVPIAQYQSKVGNIQDFKSIRFMRMFMTDFADTSILRFARLQLVRGEWRRYNAEKNPAKALTDFSLNNPGLDNSTLDVTTVSLEDNGTRTPIPYVIPPGIQREKDYSNFSGNTQKNEQSLSVVVKNLRDGYARAAFKTTVNDVRSYKRLQMFVHAEGDQLKDGDINAFIRLGTDYQDNYYEYEIPTKITQPGTQDPNLIWPTENNIDIAFALFQQAKTARNSATYQGQPWPVNVPFTYSDGKNTITVKGQPDLSKVRVLMLGVRNPVKTLNPNDDGLDKSAEVWFDELRLTDFDEKGGWAATARLNAKLADFGDVTVSANKSTIGFGSLEQRVSELNRSDNQFFDVSSSFELGKFFPEKTGIKIPMYINYSSQLSTPRFDPKNPDIELKNVLNKVNKATRDSILNYAQDFTQRRSINFTNVRKIKTNPNAKNHLWDIENWSLTYAYTEYGHHDFINKDAQQRTYRGALAYNFNNPSKFITPFNKAIKSKSLALLKDFNFSLIPSVLNFRIEANRLYSENTLRDNDPNNFIPIQTTFNKNFQINRLYGISWDLTKSLKLDFNATNLSTVDEPQGRIIGLKRDTVWENLKKLGRTTNYNHTISLSYNLPINKIPGFDFVNVITRYQTQFTWMTQPLISLNDPNLDFGNTIQNSRTVQVNPTLNFNLLYNKLGFYRRIQNPNYDGSGFGKILLNLLTSVKNISGSYIKNEGIFLPGYLPKTNAFGIDFSTSAPGLGFVLGSQQDIRFKALNNGWLTQDTLQNQLYVTNKNEKIDLKGTLEPFKDFRIELTAFKNDSKNFSTNFRYTTTAAGFESLSPVTSGNYSISIISLGSAFKDKNGSKNSAIFQQFIANRTVVSQRLGRSNPNSNGIVSNFADGYGKNSQEVMIPAFLAAYENKDPNKISLSKFPRIPVPNWRITYNGLTKLEALSNIFTTFNLTHSYSSSYNVNSFNSLIRYSVANGGVVVRDADNNFLPDFQITQITLFEQFVPLLGVDMRFKNNMTANAEFRKSRSLSLGLSNSQLASQKDQAFVFGFGYRTNNFRFPFGLFKNFNLKNDLNFKLDVAVRDSKTVIYRADVNEPEISAGSKNITYRPSIDYVINQRFNLNFFYDSNITKPYTSQTFVTAFTNFGINLRFTIQ